MSEFTTWSQEDINLTEVMPVDWYWVEITNFEKKQAANGGSDNYILQGKIISNEQGKTDFAGRRTPWWSFNSKMMGFARGMWESLGVKIGPGAKTDWSALPGQKVLVFIDQDMYQGQLVNRMTNKYKPTAA